MTNTLDCDMQTCFCKKFCLVCGNVNEKSSNGIDGSKLEASTTLGLFVMTCLGYAALAVVQLGCMGAHAGIICMNTLNITSQT